MKNKIRFEMCTDIDPDYRDVCCFVQNIYLERHGVEVKSFPDLFSYAHVGGQIVGSFGLFLGREQQPFLIETYFDEDILGLLAKGQSFSRRQAGEMGARALNNDLVKKMQIKAGSLLINLGLSVHLIFWSHHLGLQYAVFTGNRTIKRFGQILDTELINFGQPDISKKGPDFLANWQNFFKAKYECFGFLIDSAMPGIRKQINSLEENGCSFQF